MKLWEDERQCYIRAAMEQNTPEENEVLKKRLQEIDWSVFEHVDRKETVNERGVFAPLEAVELAEIRAREQEFREIGLRTVREGKVGAVLLAGGQGTRLGLDKPKGTLNIGMNRTLYLFEQLLRNLMDVTEEAGAYVPLYIMTSNINDKDTKEFFEEHDYFGYPKEEVRFFVQEMEPACDYEKRVLMESGTEPAMSPNGNGGWFGSMVSAGLLPELQQKGIEWLNVFAVDNCLQRIADPLFIGATIAYGRESGAKVVRKAAPDEKVGVLCTEDGRPSIAEYYEMTEEMATARKENGDLLYGFGVILCKGLLKIMSKMGISTIRSYRGAKLFEPIGISQGLLRTYFGTPTSAIGGIRLEEVAQDAIALHDAAFSPDAANENLLPHLGMYSFRKDGEKHAWNPETISLLQLATRLGSYSKFKEFTALVDEKDNPIFLRDFFTLKKKPISIDKVEPVEQIVKHFVTGAMSFGAISKEAHEALALAMNKMGTRSNTGEGGEDSSRFSETVNGISLCSKTKQIASGRFGVTAEYL